MILISLFLSVLAHANAEPKAGTNGWEAYGLLQSGNMRFYEGKMMHPHLNTGRISEVSTGQSPHTIILSCSDSRVPPEEIFDQGLGDVFTVRVAGNVVNAENIASIEYAIEHLGARLVVVMGHESCGAVGAAVASKPGVTSGSDSLDVLVTKIRGNLSASAVAEAGSDKTMRSGVKENVAKTMQELLKRSEIVRNAIQKKGLVVAHAVYSLKTGRVEFWDATSKLAENFAAPTDPSGKTVVVRDEVVASENIEPAKPKAKTTKTKTASADHHH